MPKSGEHNTGFVARMEEFFRNVIQGSSLFHNAVSDTQATTPSFHFSDRALNLTTLYDPVQYNKAVITAALHSKLNVMQCCMIYLIQISLLRSLI